MGSFRQIGPYGIKIKIFSSKLNNDEAHLKQFIRHTIAIGKDRL